MYNALQDKVDAIYNLAKAEWERETVTDFQRLKSIPSSEVKRFLKFYNSLRLEDATRWSKINLLRVPSMFLPQWSPTLSVDDEHWLEEVCNALCGVFWGWETWGLRELKNAISWSKSEKTRSVDISWIPPDKIKWLQSMSTAKATQIRRLIKPLFREEFGLLPKNMGGGEWMYNPANGTDFLIIHLDFGGIGAQLRYDVDIKDAATNISWRQLLFESILGLTCNGWDWIIEEEAENSCQLLVNLIKQVLDFSSRVCDVIK